MTDFTTSNPSEVQDMVDKLKGMLQHISDTFVNASNLAETVRNLQTQISNDSQRWSDELAALRTEVDHVRQQNAMLDEMVQNVRRERDEAQAEAAKLREENASISHHRDQLASEVQGSHYRISELEQQLAQTKREHDEAEYRAMHWEEQHSNVKRQLDGIKAALGVAVEKESAVHSVTTPEPQTGTGW